VQVAANGSIHHIRIHRDLIKSYGVTLSAGIGYSSSETKVRVRVQSCPKGEVEQPNKDPHPLTDLFFPRSGLDVDNPLGIDATEPNFGERLLNPVKALAEAEERQRTLTEEKHRLLENRSTAEIVDENTGIVTRLDKINRELHNLEQRLATERDRQRVTREEHRQVSEALENIDARVQAMEANPAMVLSHYTLKHNTKIVNLYALLAGEHLHTLKVRHEDLLNNRIPQGYVPFSAPGRVERLKARQKTARHISNHLATPGATWVNFELAPGHNIRVPADLAFERVDELHQYFADFLHDSFMAVEDATDERINLIVASQEALTETRAQATTTLVNNDDALRRAKEAFQEKLDTAKAEIERLENGKYRYQGKISDTRQEAEALVDLIIGTERKIGDLQTQIDDYEALLDNSRPKLSFAGRMSKLFLLSGGMVVFEAWNLSSMTEKLSNNYRNTRGWIDFGSALADFGATIAGSAQYILESKYGSRKVVKSRLDNLTRERFIRTYPLTARSGAWILRAYNIAAGANILSGVLGSLICLIDAYNRWVLGDRDAAVAYGVAAVGFALTAAAAVPVLEAASAVLGLVGFGLVVIGFTLVYFLTDASLETLLKNCSFGSEPAQRYGGNGFLQDESYIYWRERRDLAYHACVSELFQPSVRYVDNWPEDEDCCEITIQTPGLGANGVFQFDIQAWHDKKEQWETITLVSNLPGMMKSSNPKTVRVKADGATHRICVDKEFIQSFNSQDGHSFTYNTVKTKLRVRVQYYPQGEAARLFPGAPTTYVLPAPKRNDGGYPIVNGEVVDVKTATEHAWVVVEGEITDRESRSLEEIAKAGRPMY